MEKVRCSLNAYLVFKISLIVSLIIIVKFKLSLPTTYRVSKLFRLNMHICFGVAHAKLALNESHEIKYLPF